MKKRIKRVREQKTRILRPDLGETNDGLYSTYSSSSYGFRAYPKAEREKLIRSLYNSYKASRSVKSSTDVSTWPFGSETLNSTVVNDRLRWSNCAHLSIRSVQHPIGRICMNWNAIDGSPYYTEIREPFYRYPSTLPYWRDAANTALYSSLSDEQMFSARAFWSMRPKWESDVSLINSIFELKDFSDVATYLFGARGLTRAVLRASRSLKRFANHAFTTNGDMLAWSRYTNEKKTHVIDLAKKGYSWLTKPDSRVEDVLSPITKGAAASILTYNLAVMPTIRDAIAIHAAAQKNVHELAKEFKKFGEEGARSHYTENTTLHNSLTFGTYNDSLFGRGKYVVQKRSAMMVSYYTLLWERFEDMYPKWWGLEIGADEIWNMLPLSFVLDYLFTVGKSLEYMDVDKRIDVHHVDYLESVKTLATQGTHYLHNARTTHLIINGKYIEPRSKGTCLLVTGTMGKYYKRSVKEPYKGPALPKLKAPSVTQAVNLAALVRCLLF